MNDNSNSTSASSSNEDFIFSAGNGETYIVSPVNMTTSSVIASSAGMRSQLTKEAWLKFSSIEVDKSVANATREILEAIDEITYVYMSIGVDIHFLPPITLSKLEDGSVAIEWITQYFRIGFNLETDLADSGWYYATSRELGDSGKYGELSKENTRKAVVDAVNFALANS